MQHRIKRFNLVKKIIELDKKELYSKLVELKVHIEKKETSIHLFQGYLSEYQEKMRQQSVHNVATFVNFQLFLDKIAKILHKEIEDLKLLNAKKEDLKVQLLKKTHQIDALDDTLSRLKT